uniref:Peptidase S1 domain-containing protein n=1 Tax=Serinus canaria TaxID=9135 RepID=A0A8C9MZJ3_SERCA
MEGDCCVCLVDSGTGILQVLSSWHVTGAPSHLLPPPPAPPWLLHLMEPEPPNLTPECQQQLAVARSVASWIVGGHEAPEGAWPWVVSLQVLRGGVRFVHLCGGVLLSRRAVLTAGHCVDGRTDPCSWRAVLGVHNLQKHSRHTARRRIRRIIVHSEFKRETFENDVAVFELRSAVRYSLYIQPVCLPPAVLVQPLENSSDCYITGWGRTTEKGTGLCPCWNPPVSILTHSMFPGRNPLHGDSGGPLVCYHPDTDKYFLIGIASFGVGCGRPRYPGIYVRLSQYRKWIKAKLLLTNKTWNPLSTTFTILLTLVHTVLMRIL